VFRRDFGGWRPFRGRRVGGSRGIGPDGLVHRCRRLPDVDPRPGEARRPANNRPANDQPERRQPDPRRPEPRQPEPRQRWRLTYARHVPASAATVGREYAVLWENAIGRSGLPALVQESGRPRVVFAASLPVGTAGERELLDLWLSEPRTAWQVREALVPVLPERHEIVGLENVWVGAPPLPGRVAGADYVVRLADPGGSGRGFLRAAAARLLAADHLPRERVKGGGTKSYDLRPLLDDLAVEDSDDEVLVRIRTVSRPDIGSGRPDEVLAALGEITGGPLPVLSIVRARIRLADDRDEPTPASPLD
jgi:radical SAM-linked protein